MFGHVTRLEYWSLPILFHQIPLTFDSKLEPLSTDYTIVEKDTGYKPPIDGKPKVSVSRVGWAGGSEEFETAT